jgi:hypothetical protein
MVFLYLILNGEADKDISGIFYALIFPAILIWFVAANFMYLKIEVCRKHVRVRYGIIKYTVLKENIEEAGIADYSAWKLGGVGVRFSRIAGRNTITFNKMGGKKAEILLKNTRFKRLVFSTNNPENAVSAINSLLTTEK